MEGGLDYVSDTVGDCVPGILSAAVRHAFAERRQQVSPQHTKGYRHQELPEGVAAAAGLMAYRSRRVLERALCKCCSLSFTATACWWLFVLRSEGVRE